MDFYQTLGDLLKQTLEDGEVRFVKVDAPPTGPQIKKESVQEKQEAQPGAILRNKSQIEYQGPLQNGTVYHSGQGVESKPINFFENNFAQKKLTQELERAYRFFGLNPSAGMDKIKKAYKEKIKYYHPDNYTGKPVLIKIATDKTRQALEYYKLICSSIFEDTDRC